MPVPPDSFMEQEQPIDGEETDEQILDLWMTWPPEEMKYVGLHGAARVAVEEVRKSRTREPLVQEVIRATHIVASFDQDGGNLNDFDRAMDSLEKACRKLAEHKHG